MKDESLEEQTIENTSESWNGKIRNKRSRSSEKNSSSQESSSKVTPKRSRKNGRDEQEEQIETVVTPKDLFSSDLNNNASIEREDLRITLERSSKHKNKTPTNKKPVSKQIGDPSTSSAKQKDYEMTFEVEETEEMEFEENEIRNSKVRKATSPLATSKQKRSRQREDVSSVRSTGSTHIPGFDEGIGGSKEAITGQK